MTSSPLPYTALLPLDGVVRDYPWGSPTAIPQLLGRPATGAPAAELWLGAHPGGAARIVGTRRDLASAIASSPEQLLGADILARFGPELPFLMKVIAPAPRPVRQPHVVGEETWFDASVPEFQLSVHQLSDLVRIPPAGPQILLCTKGEAYVTVHGEHRSLPRGAAAFVAAGHPMQLVGRATVFRATTGE